MSREQVTVVLRSNVQMDYVKQVLTRVDLDGERLWEVVIQRHQDKRTKRQNRALWAACTDVAKQVAWYGRYLDKDSWKQMFVAALKGQDAVPGIDGGFVVLGGSSRRLRKHEFGDLLDLIFAFGNEHEVTWSDRTTCAYDDYLEMA